MLSLRDVAFVPPPISVRSLAALAGLNGVVSLRELLGLLGGRQFGPMPLYLIGHNTNKLSEVRGFLAGGANAVEVDVTAYAHDLSRLCVDHAGVLGDSPADPDAPALEDFLRGLREIVDKQPEKLALVVFDCKPPAATPEHGKTLLAAIRRILTAGTRLNVIISVADVTSSTPFKLDGTTMFDLIRGTERPREGFMIDAQDDPDEVSRFFAAAGVARFGYGDGTSFRLTGVVNEGDKKFRRAVERACWMRVVKNGPRFVYAWTVNSRDNQEMYLRIGVNGLIVDPDGLFHLRELLRHPEFADRYRFATPVDNPLLPPNSCYGLSIQTSDMALAGTDANLHVSLTGSRGVHSVTVDASFAGRMERGSLDFVILPAPDLGELLSVTVRRDRGGFGSDWHLSSIVVESFRYGGRKIASFNRFIDSTDSFTRPLVSQA